MTPAASTAPMAGIADDDGAVASSTDAAPEMDGRWASVERERSRKPVRDKLASVRTAPLADVPAADAGGRPDDAGGRALPEAPIWPVTDDKEAGFDIFLAGLQKKHKTV
jgi:hypothetical protein